MRKKSSPVAVEVAADVDSQAQGDVSGHAVNGGHLPGAEVGVGRVETSHEAVGDAHSAGIDHGFRQPVADETADEVDVVLQVARVDDQLAVLRIVLGDSLAQGLLVTVSELIVEIEEDRDPGVVVVILPGPTDDERPPASHQQPIRRAVEHQRRLGVDAHAARCRL